MSEEYKAFLQQIKDHPDRWHTPTEAVDDEWHAHILDTYKYTKFCDEFFGAYLHHRIGADGYCAASLGV